MWSLKIWILLLRRNEGETERQRQRDRETARQRDRENSSLQTKINQTIRRKKNARAQASAGKSKLQKEKQRENKIMKQQSRSAFSNSNFNSNLSTQYSMFAAKRVGRGMAKGGKGRKSEQNGGNAKTTSIQLMKMTIVIIINTHLEYMHNYKNILEQQPEKIIRIHFIK